MSVTRHKAALIQTLKVPKDRVPSDSKIGRVMMGIDFEELICIFNNWAIANTPPEERRRYAVDGKTLKGSHKELEEAYKDFIQTEVIIESKKPYLIAVKKNQKKLYELLEMKRESCESVDQHISPDNSKGRPLTRTVEVFDNISCINQNYWKGIQSFLCVTRRGLRNGKPYYERVYYISSLLMSAEEFGQRI